MNFLSQLCVCSFIGLIAHSAVFGQDYEEPIIPASFPASRYQEEWKNSAFLREVVARVVEKKIGPSFAASLKLEGLVMDSTGPIAYVRNTANNSPLVITKAKPKAGEKHSFQIVDANLKANPEETSITITNGVETAEIKYEAAMLTAPIKTSRPATTSAKKPPTKITRRAPPVKQQIPRTNSTPPTQKPKTSPLPNSGVPSGPAPSGDANKKKPLPNSPAPRRKVVLPK